MKTRASPKIGHYSARFGILLVMLALAIGTTGCTIGNDGEPTEISNWEQLNAVRNNLAGSYVLMSHLDEATEGYNEWVGDTADGKGWQPLGTTENPFRGIFDGNGNTISGLFIYRPDEDEVGLFGHVKDGTVENLGLVNVDVTGKKWVGALVGYSWRGTLHSDILPPDSKTYSHGIVTGEENVGGLVGNNFDGTVNQCESSVEVFHLSGTPDEQRWRAGGLVGLNSGTVLHCDYNGVVNGYRQVGGLVGLNEYLFTTGIVGLVQDCGGNYSVNGDSEVGGVAGTNVGIIKRSSFTGDVNGILVVDGLVAPGGWTFPDPYSSDTAIPGSYVGGVVGVNEGTVEDCSAEATVEGYQYVGGLTGTNNGTLEDCNATATVKGYQYVGGLAGANAGDLERCSSSGDVTGSLDAGRLVGYNMVMGIVSGSESTGCVFEAPDCGLLVGVNHGLIRFYLTLSSSEGGEVSIPGEGTFAYDDGGVVNLLATPYAGYRFFSWTGDVGTIADVHSPSINIALHDNYTITANFTPSDA